MDPMVVSSCDRTCARYHWWMAPLSMALEMTSSLGVIRFSSIAVLAVVSALSFPIMPWWPGAHQSWTWCPYAIRAWMDCWMKRIEVRRCRNLYPVLFWDVCMCLSLLNALDLCNTPESPRRCLEQLTHRHQTCFLLYSVISLRNCRYNGLVLLSNRPSLNRLLPKRCSSSKPYKSNQWCPFLEKLCSKSVCYCVSMNAQKESRDYLWVASNCEAKNHLIEGVYNYENSVIASVKRITTDQDSLFLFALF